MEHLLLLWILTQPLHEGTVEEYGYLVHAVDCMQTYEIFHNDRYYEKNPLFKDGKNGGWKGVCLYGLGLHYTMNKVLENQKHKDMWNWYFAIDKTYAVANNYKIGIRIKF